MAHIFISYAHEEEGRIQPLVRTLENQGWSVFWDRRIPAGQTWRNYIGKALSATSCVIVAWSQPSIDSDWVSEEADQGRKRGILVPILLDPLEPPIGFRSLQAADLTNWQLEHPSARFTQLLHDIKEILPTTLTMPPREPLAELELNISKPPPNPVWHEPRVTSLRLIYNTFVYGTLVVVLLVLVVAGVRY